MVTYGVPFLRGGEFSHCPLDTLNQLPSGKRSHSDCRNILIFHRTYIFMTGVTHISPTSVLCDLGMGSEHLTKQNILNYPVEFWYSLVFSKQKLIYNLCFKKTPLLGKSPFFNFKVPRNPTEAIVLRQHRLLSVALIFDFVPNIKPATWSDCRNLDDGSRV